MAVSVAGLVVFLTFWSGSDGSGLQLQGDYSISGLFPLHNSAKTIFTTPYLQDCKQGKSNRHGYHLVQALRYAVEEINNGTQNTNLLPGITLGYQTYDICSLPASILATLDLLSQQYDSTGVDPRAVAVIGPDSSSYTFTPAATLGSYLVPQISYEASNEMLSRKTLYPSFLRTIPSDKNQVNAMIQLLVRFNWTWIALLGSDNDYGLQGMQSLSEQASVYGICVAYQAVIPSYSDDKRERMQKMVEAIIRTKVNTIVAFSSKRIITKFFPFVIEQNVTGKVWIGTEDWSVASLVSGIPGIQTIGTVLGVSVTYSPFHGFQDFESQTLLVLRDMNDSASTGEQSVTCLQNTDFYSMVSYGYPLENYDIISAFNVYKAVYAVAHALHSLLDCDSGECRKTDVEPWQLLRLIKQVRFSVRNSSVYFDKNGDPPTGYDIVTWRWSGGEWSLQVVGSYTPDPPDLQIDPALVLWSAAGSRTRVPESLCSPECPFGHQKLLTGQHKCCFDCLACTADTYLNKTDSTSCKPCAVHEWSPAEREACLARTLLYLPWDSPLTGALLFLQALTLLLTLGTAFIFLLNLDTPVVKSAGGKTCLVMLLSLTTASLSPLCHFGKPTHLSCLFKQPLFMFSITVFLSCVTVRSFQVVCIFKWSSKLPHSYEAWAKNRGPEKFILVSSLCELLISLLRVSLDVPFPSLDHDFYHDSTVVECSKTLSPGAYAELIYVALLSILCFSLSYLGKDLPANYNEAKCITFSLMVYIISWITLFTVYSVNRSTYCMALYVVAILSSVLGLFGGYFMPKVYIIVLKPEMNTTAHFQNCIQMYTMSK